MMSRAEPAPIQGITIHSSAPRTKLVCSGRMLGLRGGGGRGGGSGREGGGVGARGRRRRQRRRPCRAGSCRTAGSRANRANRAAPPTARSRVEAAHEGGLLGDRRKVDVGAGVEVDRLDGDYLSKGLAQRAVHLAGRRERVFS
jgi:hypothetical protein